mgnify:CR=1 FL=1
MASFQNQATLFYGDRTSLSNTVYGEIGEPYSMTKTAVSGTYSSGDALTYVVSIVNSSNTTLTGVTLTDNMGRVEFGSTALVPLEYVDGSILYYTNGNLQAAPTVTEGPPLEIRGITVPAGGNATIIYEARTNGYAPIGEGGSILNTVTATGAQIADALTAQETVTAQAAPVLSITKSLSPTTVNSGDTLTYTFVIQNTGNAPADAADGVQIVDEFDPALDITSVTLDGAAFTEYSYVGNVFSTNAGSITVPAATITQDATTGVWSVSPGVTTVTVSGTVR